MLSANTSKFPEYKGNTNKNGNDDHRKTSATKTKGLNKDILNDKG
eukprot:CAMPEP_0202451026 /NCGR_PEP_ID=MMETSP1360-20130828/9545_1 /ASSEMBLY_ACC=CAM_ASM_000848 /TAXON_ID=515479 /ORGANISM="Licmophora paradoxa, Strain CCMP2313" /LENGTH=44 /DNA_ID= /DNA_START= /DNA_END= /DNA_ORIENTATION=